MLSSTSVMYLIMSMVLWFYGMGANFVEASHPAPNEFRAIQRAGSGSRRFLSASSYSAGLCKSIIQVAGYPCEEITVTAISLIPTFHADNYLQLDRHSTPL